MSERIASLLTKIKSGFQATVGTVKQTAEYKDRVVGVLNGIAGDTLAASKSGYAIEMAFYSGKQPVKMDAASLTRELSGRNRVCLFVHGNSDNEETWLFKDGETSYGSLLALRGLGSLYLRYNSGLHISQNGRKLAFLLEELFLRYPRKIRELFLIGHSMGGLVIRSACFYAEKENFSWVRRVKKIVFLGTPHEGALLEKLGTLSASTLQMVGSLYTNAIAAVINLRSAGIQDLHHGYLTDEDWQQEKKSFLPARGRKVNPLKGVEYYGIASTLTGSTSGFFARYLGDGMVHPATAGAFARRLEKHFVVIPNLSHLGLVSSPVVFAHLEKFLRD